MKRHTQEYKEQIKEFGRELDSIITYELNGETVELGVEELNSITPHYESTILKSTMKQLDIDSNVDIPLGTILNYQFGVKVNEQYEYLNYGNYVVYSSEKQENANSYKITCYDKMLYSMKNYENMNITYPITVRNYINEICTYLGLTFKNINDEFANYDKEIKNELYLDTEGNDIGYTFRDVFDELAQVTASTICINEDDELEIRYIEDAISEINEVEGSEISIDNVANTKPLDLELQGDTYQKTYTGKNLLLNYIKSISTSRGITFTYNEEDGTYTLNGINNGTGNSAIYLVNVGQGTDTFTLPAGTYYSLYDTNLGIVLYDGSRYYNFDYEGMITLTQETTFRIVYIQVRNGSTIQYNNYKFYPIISSTPITEEDYEPYVGGIASPNPDYPQNIEVVTGRQEINITGKNLANTYLLNATGSSFATIVVEEDGTLIISGNARDNGYINTGKTLAQVCPNLKVGDTVYLHIDTTFTRRNFIYIGENWYNESSKTITQAMLNSILVVYGGYQEISQIKIIISKQLETTYEPYKGQNYEINLGKQLYDENNEDGTLNQSGTIAPSNTSWRTVNYTNVIPNQKYSLTAYDLSFSSTAGRVHFYDKNKIGLSYINITSNNFSFVVPENAYYVKFWYSKSSVPSDSKVQLEKGEKSTYSEYFEPIELCKIEDYQDKIYKDNGKWYLEKQIDKIILDGSETYTSGSTNTSGVYRIRTTTIAGLIKKPSSAGVNGDAISNYFRITTANQNYQCVQGFGVETSGALVFYDSSGNTQTTSAFTNWLSTHNIEVYYALATPTTTEITNTELINQLNSIELLKGTNNIEITSEDLPSILKLTYISEYETINEEYLKDINVNFGEKYGPINSIVLSRAGESDNVYLQDEDSIEQNGLCEIKIKDNQIMNFNDRSDYLPDILEKLDGLEYYLNDFSSTGITYLDLCDRYNVQIDNSTYSCVMFNDETNITQGLEENIYTDMPEESETDYTKADKTDRRINQTYIIVDKQNQQITSLVNEVGEYDERITTIEQDIDSIEQSVEAFENLKRNVISTNYLHITDAVPNYPIKFSIKNARQIFPKSDLYPSNTLYPKGSYLVIDKTLELSEDAKMIKLPPLDLKVKDGVYDEFIVEKNTMYIIHRIGVNQDGTTYVLPNEIIENLGTIDIILFDEENYIYLYSFKYDGTIYELDYTTHSLFTDVFATEVYVNSEIEQTANQIMLQVNEKVDEEEIIAKLNVAVEDGQGVINLVGNTVTIDSDNFKLYADGKIVATAGKIGGFNLNETNFNILVEGRYNYTNADCNAVKNYILELLSATNHIIELYDYNDDNNLSAIDYTRMRNTLNGAGEYYKNIKGKFTINSDDPKNCIQLLDENDNPIISIGMGGLNAELLTTEALVVADPNDYNTSGLTDGIYADKTGNLTATQTITCNNLIQTSKEKNKKNFEKYNCSALKEIQNIDIYKYNLKSEDDKSKKHIGFVIGDNFNYSKEVTNSNNDGVDNYSFTSLLCKAIQEQQEEIDLLKKEIELLKNKEERL